MWSRSSPGSPGSIRSLDDAPGGGIVERVVCYFEVGVVLSVPVLKIVRTEIVVSRSQNVRHLAIEHVKGLFGAAIARRIVLIDDVAALNHRLILKAALLLRIQFIWRFLADESPSLEL